MRFPLKSLVQRVLAPLGRIFLAGVEKTIEEKAKEPPK